MDEPVVIGLILGSILSAAGPWVVRRPAIQMDAFLGNLSVNSSAAIASIPLPLTPMLIAFVGLIDDVSDDGAIEALLLCSAVVVLVGWPVAFFFARGYIANARGERRQDPGN